jgi:hypothetical protein
VIALLIDIFLVPWVHHMVEPEPFFFVVLTFDVYATTISLFYR